MIGSDPWSAAMDIRGWLRSLGLGQYEALFRASDIYADILPELTEVDLEKLANAMRSAGASPPTSARRWELADKIAAAAPSQYPSPPIGGREPAPGSTRGRGPSRSDAAEASRLAEMRRGLAINREQGGIWFLPAFEPALAFEQLGRQHAEGPYPRLRTRDRAKVYAGPDEFVGLVEHDPRRPGIEPEVAFHPLRDRDTARRLGGSMRYRQYANPKPPVCLPQHSGDDDARAVLASLGFAGPRLGAP
jgi:hypothetical protein